MNLDDIGLEYDKKVDEMKTSEFDKNIILYGPPGTGKTYNTAIYTVAICDGKSIDDLTDYDMVMTRYNELKAQNRVAFTTFHQSYGYEEFIEGIKPIVNENIDESVNDIGYTIEPGIFKKFCDEASKKKIVTNDETPDISNARVWCVLLDRAGESELKKKCFEEGSVRIGWKDDPVIIEDDTEGLTADAKKMLLYFQNEMAIGDVIVVGRSNKSIDGIGILTGEYKFDDNDEEYPRMRTVKWLMSGTEINLIDMNEGHRLARRSVYKLKRVTANDILSLVEISDNLIIEDETKPYVFIIDEINRGNMSKIFGELITLIEDNKREGMSEEANAILPYSGRSSKAFSVPSNVYILGTMNTADRSIALMDTALRRRFKFIEMQPDADVLRAIGADKVIVDEIELDVAAMLDTINERISFLYDREHTIGHAFFTCLAQDNSIEKLASIFSKSVIPLLQEYFYEDYQKIQLVLGDNGKTDDNLKFIRDTKVIAKNIFKGSVDDVIDLPEKKYEINKDAFTNILSYIEIM